MGNEFNYSLGALYLYEISRCSVVWDMPRYLPHKVSGKLLQLLPNSPRKRQAYSGPLDFRGHILLT
jgi:hypothetical protein